MPWALWPVKKARHKGSEHKHAHSLLRYIPWVTHVNVTDHTAQKTHCKQHRCSCRVLSNQRQPIRDWCDVTISSSEQRRARSPVATNLNDKYVVNIWQCQGTGEVTKMTFGMIFGNLFEISLFYTLLGFGSSIWTGNSCMNIIIYKIHILVQYGISG